jgi:hypothetical protein
MHRTAPHGIYDPLNVPKALADDLWVVDGPTIRFGLPWLKFPFPTRMTVVRLPRRELFIHSPTPLTPDLKRTIKALGIVCWIIGPNRLHYWWFPEWHAAFPGATVYLSPAIARQAGDRIDFSTRTLQGAGGYPWDNSVETIPVPSDYLGEFGFFHRASRTLILTDLIENFEPRKLTSTWMRWLTWLGGAQDPDGQTPRDLRPGLKKNEAQVRAAVSRMVELDPERVIIAHGRCYESNGTRELTRAFRWILDR